MHPLKTERELRGWSQAKVAEIVGTSPRNVSRWEQGHTLPHPYYREQLCFLFGKNARELGILEESPFPLAYQAVAAGDPSSEVALWTIPYARNPHFTGRDVILSQLVRQFSHERSGSTALLQTKAIRGLGGIGKTQIALEYAYRAREQGRYTHTLWIAAASEEAILTSFITIADQLPAVAAKGETPQRERVSAVINWLEQCEQPWLLIVDNADELSLVQPYVPVQGNGSILFTTRASALGSLASSIEVDIMNVMEGTQLLLRRSQRLTDASADEIDDARRLVVELAQFPLALDQAGAYIEETGCSISTYHHLYQDHREALLARRGSLTSSYSDSVATTWSLSFQRIEQKNPAAAQLLRLCAFLAPDHIPEELLTVGAAYWPSELQQAVSDPLAFNQLFQDLLLFSLVKRLAKDRMLSIHRLVQVVQIERIELQEQRHWAERVVRAVHTVFPRDPRDEVATWPQCQRYLKQAEACDTLIQRYQLLFPEAAEVLDSAGIYLRELALYRLAEPFLQRALSIREQLMGLHDPATAQSLNNLAVLYYRQGKDAQAELLHQRALCIREQQGGSHNPATAQSLLNLALLYDRQGKYEQAQPLYERALSIAEQLLGPDHVKTALCLLNLALLYSRQGKYEQAQPLYERALSISEQVLGPDHVKTALCLLNLAGLYSQQGKDAQAEPLYQRALRIREQQLGPEHPDVASSLNGLAYISARQGRYVQAESLYQRALAIWEQQVGPEHPGVAFSLNGLAILYSQQGKDEQKEVLYQRALKLWGQQEEPEHSSVTSPLNVSNFFFLQGKDAQVEHPYQRTFPIRELPEDAKDGDMTEILQDFASFQ